MSSTSVPVRVQPRSSGAWAAYFRRNLGRLLDMPWERGAQWDEQEKSSIARSLQDFQLGESSEGHHLIARADRFARQNGDLDYAEAVRLFIREEQRHSRLLGDFLKLADVPLVRYSKLDFIFRFIRRLAGLELCITILVIAETIGKVYYQALRRSTSSPLLRRICDQLLRDEVMHLRFHAERLALLRKNRSRWRVGLRQWSHRLLFRVTSLAVWWKHRRAFRATGLSFLQYCASAGEPTTCSSLNRIRAATISAF